MTGLVTLPGIPVAMLLVRYRQEGVVVFVSCGLSLLPDCVYCGVAVMSYTSREHDGASEG